MTTPATSTAEGVETRTCNRCGMNETRPISMLKPTITRQPISQTVIAGEKVSFKVVATGATSYQWYYKKPNATSWTKSTKTTATYSLTAKETHNGYQYKCLVSNDAGSVWSDVAVLTVKTEPENELPVITKQPVSLTVFAGEKAVFNVEATNATSYLWYYKKPNTTTWTKSAKTTATYSLTAGTVHNGFQYKCLVSNDAGSVWSDVAELTVNELPENGLPVITTQPASTTVLAGEKVTFKVEATNAVSYLWYYKKPNTSTWTKSNKTTATYSLTAGTVHNGFQYKCLVSNDTGSVWSDVAELTVNELPENELPVITKQPVSLTVFAGEKAVFNVEATNVASYLWYYKKPNTTTWTKSAKTTATYSLTAGTVHNGFQYKCLLSNDTGSVWSDVAELTVNELPENGLPIITTQPASTTVIAGEKVTFMVVASNATSYQWYYRASSSGTWDTIKNNGTNTSYSINTTKAKHSGYQYRCLVSNDVGSVMSDTATLTVKSLPVITTQPASTTVNAGEKVTFKVEATNATSYQWYYRASSSGTWDTIKNNGTNTSYSINTTKAKHSGYQYRCLVSNDVGSVMSDTATLTVKAEPSAVLPIITTQPISLTANAGQSVSFKVTAINATGYLWYYKGPNDTVWTKSSKTTATYSLTAKEVLNGYQYKCQVSNNAGFVWSDIAALTVKVNLISVLPVITTQPASTTVNAGEKVTFKVVASNATSYQWYYRASSSGTWDTIKNNGTNTSYSINTTKAKHSGYQYRCLVSNDVGSVMSDTATLTVKAEPSAVLPIITTQPISLTANAGQSVSFKVTAINATGYLWYYKGPNDTVWTKSSKTTATYSLTAKEVLNGYQYKCQVSNDAGFVWSDTAVLTVKVSLTSVLPVMTTQPTSLTANAGQSVSPRAAAADTMSFLRYCKKPNATSWIKTTKTTPTYTTMA